MCWGATKGTGATVRTRHAPGQDAQRMPLHCAHAVVLFTSQNTLARMLVIQGQRHRP